MAVDFKVQRGTATIATSATTATITAGVDYDAPSATGKAFCRINAVGALAQTTAEASTAIDVWGTTVDDSAITTSVVFERVTGDATHTVRVDWEIVEYIGAGGGANEFVVRGRGILAFTATSNTATTSTIGSVATDADMIPWITGARGTSASIHPSDYRTTAAWDAGGDTITFTRDRDTGTAPLSVSWAAIEFTGSNWTVQSVSDTITTTDTTETVAISTVGATSRAFLHVQFHGPVGGNTNADGFARVWLSDVDEVSSITSSAFAATSITVKAWVVSNSQTGSGEMVVARYSDTTSSSGEVSKTITSAVMADTSIMEVTATQPQATGSPSRHHVSAKQATTTGVTVFAAGGTTATISYRFAAVTWPLAAGGGSTQPIRTYNSNRKRRA